MIGLEQWNCGTDTNTHTPADSIAIAENVDDLVVDDIAEVLRERIIGLDAELVLEIVPLEETATTARHSGLGLQRHCKDAESAMGITHDVRLLRP
jgi:hypothetical protein